MNDAVMRATLVVIGCLSLFGCTIPTKTTSLKDIPSKPEETSLLRNVGFVIHDEVLQTRGGGQKADERAYLDSERKSWVDAISAFTDQKNIFTMSNDKPTNSSNSFPEFAKSHPIVDVYVKADKDKSGLSANDIAYGSFWITFLSFGLTPAYLPVPYVAAFTLSMPQDDHIPVKRWEYSYDREEYYWIPLLIPMEDYLNSFTAPDDNEVRWNTEEKRRLILKFLQDAKPILEPHLIAS